MSRSRNARVYLLACEIERERVLAERADWLVRGVPLVETYVEVALDAIEAEIVVWADLPADLDSTAGGWS